jgi:hypothetical protein
VLSVNPTNLHLTNGGTVTFIDIWSTADNRAETLNYSRGIADNAYNSVLLSAYNGKRTLIGMETFVNGVAPLSQNRPVAGRSLSDQCRRCSLPVLGRCACRGYDTSLEQRREPAGR